MGVVALVVLSNSKAGAIATMIPAGTYASSHDTLPEKAVR